MRGAARRSVTIEKARLLLVEGVRDERFFSCLLSHLELDAQVIPLEGKSNTRDRLDAVRTAPGFGEVTALGIARDADISPESTFQRVTDALKAFGLPCPEKCVEPCAGPPRVAVMLLPGKRDRGAIEDLLLKSVSDDPAMVCVEEYFSCLREQDCDLPKSESKAKVQAFLASRSKSELWLGTAAEAGIWPWESPAFDEVKGFLSSLFA